MIDLKYLCIIINAIFVALLIEKYEQIINKMNSKTNENLIFVFKRIIELIHDSFQIFLNRIRWIEYDAVNKKLNLEKPWISKLKSFLYAYLLTNLSEI